MSENINIKLPDKTITVPVNTTAGEVLKGYDNDPLFPILSARVANDHRPLAWTIDEDSEVAPITYKQSEGQNLIRRSLALLLAKSISELRHNTRLVLRQSLGNSFYYDYYTDMPVNPEMLDDIMAKMHEIIARDEKLELKEMPRQDAIDMFLEKGLTDKARLIEYRVDDYARIVKFGKFLDIYQGPLAPSTSYLKVFDLKQYNTGFVLCFPDPENPSVSSDVSARPKLFDVFRESKIWGEVIGINNVWRLNECVVKNSIGNIIKTAEALHEKKIAAIADMISSKPEVRLVLIAGPSSSGKTSFSKRLAIQLIVNGMKPVTVAMDNYFLDREKTPRDPDGAYNFESIHALDLALFNQHLSDLLAGREARLPIFDFSIGARKKETNPLRINENEIIIVEGIHGLNEELTHDIPSSKKFKIYVSALTQLSIDDYNRIATTDTRLLRRMVRDSQYRGHSAQETIQRWPSVRQGEETNIFPFQEEADVMFNSALVYELGVLRAKAEPLLKAIPNTDKQHCEARRLLRFLEQFLPIDTEEIPPTSLLREFVGGSSFHY